MQVFGLLRITHVYAEPDCMPMKHANVCVCARANQNERVQFVQTKCMSEVRAACALFMQTMMHTAAY